MATAGEPPGRIGVDLSGVPAPIAAALQGALATGRRTEARALLGIEPVRDDYNVFTVLNAASFLAFRRAYVGFLPAHALVN